MEYIDNPKLIGHRISLYRQARGLSVSKLAQLTGVPKGNIAHYERGRVVPGIPTFLKIARVLEIRPDNIFLINSVAN